MTQNDCRYSVDILTSRFTEVVEYEADFDSGGLEAVERSGICRTAKIIRDLFVAEYKAPVSGVDRSASRIELSQKLCCLRGVMATQRGHVTGTPANRMRRAASGNAHGHRPSRITFFIKVSGPQLRVLYILYRLF